MSVSATEAAFEGFRLTRQRPGAIALWGAVWLVGLIVMMFAILPFVAPWMEEIAAAQGDATKLSAEATAALQRGTLSFIPIAILLQGLLATAVYRAVLRPGEKSFGSMRVGKDEGRVLLVSVATAVVSGVLNFGGEWLAQLAGASAGPVASFGVALVVMIALIALSVRLSLIAPLTFARRKLAFREGWAASGRMFWPLLGLSVIVMTLCIVVVLLLVLIGWPLQIAVGSAAAPIGAIFMLILMPLGMAMVSTLAWAPFAAICRELPEAKT